MLIMKDKLDSNILTKGHSGFTAQSVQQKIVSLTKYTEFRYGFWIILYVAFNQ